MNAFKVIVAGSRDFSDYNALEACLDKLLANKMPDVAIVSGIAKGADKLGERYAARRNLPLLQFPANWTKYGKRAGYIRNETMAGNADALVAFWDGHSRGTKHMIETATQKGLQVRVVKFNLRQRKT